MIVRAIEWIDVDELCVFSNISRGLLIDSLSNSVDNLLIVDEGIKGFVIVSKVAGYFDLRFWSVNPEHVLALKLMVKQLRGPVFSVEREGDVFRINLLKSVGFRVIKSLDGIFPDGKAVILRFN